MQYCIDLITEMRGAAPPLLLAIVGQRIENGTA